MAFFTAVALSELAFAGAAGTAGVFVLAALAAGAALETVASTGAAGLEVAFLATAGFATFNLAAVATGLIAGTALVLTVAERRRIGKGPDAGILIRHELLKKGRGRVDAVGGNDIAGKGVSGERIADRAPDNP